MTTTRRTTEAWIQPHLPQCKPWCKLSHTCRHWLHSEMWWPRLFKGSAEIAWDDYEKDYSDLPREVLAPHAVLEGAKEATRQLEASEAAYREMLEVRALLLHALHAHRCTPYWHICVWRTVTQCWRVSRRMRSSWRHPLKRYAGKHM